MMTALEVVVAVDGSGSSRDAVDIGIYEAYLRALPLRLIHVQRYGAGGGRTGRSARLLDAAQTRAIQAEPGLDVTTTLMTGLVREQLVAASHTAAVMVIGRRHGLLTGLRVATLTGALVRRAACPVIVAQGVSQPVAHVVAAVGDTPAAVEEVLRFAFTEAAMRHTSVSVVHAAATPARVRVNTGGVAAATGGPADGADPVIAEALSEVCAIFPEVRTEVTLLDRASGEAVLAVSMYAQLIVVGRALGRKRHGVRGDTVERLLLRHAMCPVAVISA